MTVEPSPRPALSPVFWVLFWGTLVNRAASFVSVFLALHLTQDLAISGATAGWIVGCWGIGSWLASPVAGVLTDRIGRRTTMLLGLVLGGSCVLAIAFATDVRLLFGLVFVGGATYQLYYPACNATIADVVPPADRARAYGLIYWAVNLGLAIGFAIGGVVPDRYLWLLFVADAGTTFVCAALTAWRVPETRPATAHHEPALRGLARVAADRPFLAFAGLQFAVLVVFTQFQLALPLDMKAHGQGSRSFAWLMAFNCAGVVVLQPWLAPRLRRFDGSRLLAITEVPGSRFDLERLYDPTPATPGKLSSRFGGFVDGVDEFDPEFFSISPREARHMDPQQRLALEALEDAGTVATALRGSAAGVFLGMQANEYQELEHRFLPEVDLAVVTGGSRNGAAARISHMLGIEGPSIVLDTDRASSLVAVHFACQSLWSGESDLALAGGTNLVLSPEPSLALSRAGMLASDGRCKFCDARADGIVRSDGVGIVVLKRLRDAVAARDRVYAVILGTAINHNGGRSGDLMTPSRDSQAAVVRSACRAAGVAGGDVQYVEAHGTGTVVGDPIEVEALALALRSGDDAAAPTVRVGSVKTNIGHAEAAAGIAGLIKVALAIRHGTLPASLHCRVPNPAIRFDGKVLVQTEAAGWPDPAPRLIAGVTSIGLTGTNAHAVLAAPPPPPAPADAVPRHEVLPLSAASLEITQPVLVAVQVALAAQWRAWGVVPDLVAGVSMGEVAAAHVAGILALDDAVRIICERARLMKRLAGKGTMALVELPLAEAEQWIRPRAHEVSIAGSYSAGATLLSGDPRALEDVLQALRSKPVFFRNVTVEVASHSPQMDAIRAPLIEAVAGIAPAPARMPMISTVTTAQLAGPDCDPAYWGRNLRDPVRFAAALRQLAESGCNVFVEISPHPTLLGRVLDGLAGLKRRGLTLGSLKRVEPERQTLLRSLGSLYAYGYDVAWDRVFGDDGHMIDAPTYAWQRARYWFTEDAVANPPATAAALATVDREWLARLARLPAAERLAQAVELVCIEVAHVLSLKHEARVAADRPLRELGLDSALALELRHALRTRTGVELPATFVFDYPTPLAMASYLVQGAAPVNGAAHATRALEPEAVSLAELADRELAALAERLIDGGDDR